MSVSLRHERAARAARGLLGHEIADGRVGLVAPMLESASLQGGFGCPDGFLDALEQLDARAYEALANALGVGESWFFRSPEQFDFVHAAIDRARDEGRDAVHLWSAGCAGGEEALSLIITALERDAPSLRVSVLATDVSPALISHALVGRYALRAFRGEPIGSRMRWFERDGETLRALPHVRERVQFRRHNLAQAQQLDEAGTLGLWPVQCDLIFCRNVFIYFAESARRRLFERLAAALRPGGVLVLSSTDPPPPDDLALVAEGEWPQRCYRRVEHSDPQPGSAIHSSRQGPGADPLLAPASSPVGVARTGQQRAARDLSESRRRLLAARAVLFESSPDVGSPGRPVHPLHVTAPAATMRMKR